MAFQIKDTAGNTLRKVNDRWEILQAGIGWREFIGFTVLQNGETVDTRPSPQITQDVIDQEQHQKQLEDDLFRHYAGIALPDSIKLAEKDDTDLAGLESVTWAAFASCEMAQEMINELKRRGRL